MHPLPFPAASGFFSEYTLVSDAKGVRHALSLNIILIPISLTQSA
jgi:hypothetical protein